MKRQIISLWPAVLVLTPALLIGTGMVCVPSPAVADTTGEQDGMHSIRQGEPSHGHKHEQETEGIHGAEAKHADPDTTESGVHEVRGHEDENIVALDAQQRERIGLRVVEAAAGSLNSARRFPGEIVLNEDRLAHMVPRAPGIVQAVERSVGDPVKGGEIMAWIDSAELGAAKVEYLSQLAELGCCTIDLTRAEEVHTNTVEFLELLATGPSLETLRKTNGTSMGENRARLVEGYAEFVYAKAAYDREKTLDEKGIGRKGDYHAAESALKKAEANYTATLDSVGFRVQRDLLEAQQERRILEIALEGAERRLHVLGLSAEAVEELGTLAQAGPSPAPGHEEVCADPDCPTCRAEREGQAALEGPAGGAGHHSDDGHGDDHEGDCTDPNCAACRAEKEEHHSPSGEATADGRGDPGESGNSHLVLGRYPLCAPFDGTVIDKHITLGEKLDDDSIAFTIADLGTVWVDIRVYQKDLPFVREGQAVTIAAGRGGPEGEGTISFISPMVDRETRTALARVIIPNRDGAWLPGMFVDARTESTGTESPVVIPKEAVQMMGEKTVVFVESGEGFEPRAVTVGGSDSTRVEVVAGLAPGDRYAASGAFELKAMLAVSGLSSHAGHGH